MKDNLAIIGMQWGDEGKGKIVDLLAPSFEIVARFQGGNNAGHTIKVKGERIILHTIPSGVLHDKIINVIGNGVVINPDALIDEMSLLNDHGVHLKDRLFISDRAHIIMPYHLMRDRDSEATLGKRKIGTTSKGIGPAYGDKVNRRGIRISCILNDSIDERMTDLLYHNLDRMKKLYSCEELILEQILDSCKKWRSHLASYIIDTSVYLFNAINNGKRVLFEGAQGTMLDIDHGTYPYVTSSNSSACGIGAGIGLGPKMIGKILGITKAYTTRVGEGPFVTELCDRDGELLREKGQEYGATTGRPRRCGWFDMVVAKYAIRINGIDYIALTKLDVLDEFDTIKVCTGYKYQGEIIENFPADMKKLELVEPIYREFEGWKSVTAGMEKFEDLPSKARTYIDWLQEEMQCPIALLSTGPSRNESIMLERDFQDKYISYA